MSGPRASRLQLPPRILGHGIDQLERLGAHWRYHAAMAKLLLNLRNVPDDEADEVRALLAARGIDYYETRPSLWGVSAGGIWLAQATQEADARRCLADYQAERLAGAREAREADRRAGRLPGTWAGMRAQPRQAVAAVIGILLMLAVATLPFLMFAR